MPQQNFNIPGFLVYKEPLKYRIKDDMSKISIGIMLSYLIITVISLVVSVLDIESFLDIGNETTTALLYILNGIALLIALPLGAFIICRISDTYLSDCIVIKRVPAKKTALLVISGLGICMLANYMVEMLAVIAGTTGINISSQTMELSMKFTSPGTLGTMLISVAIVPALAEEFMFRGVVLTILRKYGDTFAIFISSLLFGLLHGNFVQTPFAFVVGLVLGFITVYTGSMLPSMIIHCLNNSISIIITYLNNNIELEAVTEVIYVSVSVIIAAVGLVSLFVLSKSDRHMFSLESGAAELSFSKKVRAAISEPWTLVFISIMLASSVVILVGASFV
ncbi:MAG: CPBP family intramembrane metalloprotease [Clostridiales bacterium]|nr:CPBP family intramembrane metalloprotease [Clostridiales bacterium]